ncbi:MAG: MBL fold metallo-hydrolase [Candidatus Alcyoniella australis]|nr:MBL fold metallo-hydrolase [Candidatus Alcyoniella australis]
MRLIVLGSGTSIGVPVIGCHCPVCSSSDHRDKRMRSSIYIEHEGQCLLIDTSTDLRTQALACGIEQVDAVLYTHTHADHVHGIDDLRAFNFIKGGPIPIYGSPVSIEDIKHRFDYIFGGATQAGGGLPGLTPNEVQGPFELFGLQIAPVPIAHGKMKIVGYRVGPIAYLTDCSGVPRSSRNMLHDLDLLIIGALRPFPHPTHFSFDQAVAEIERIAPRRALLTHISHHVKHSELERRLPRNVSPAYDGQVIDINA